MPFDIAIDSLVYEGYGFARLPDGKAVFVPFVLPGEKARIELTEEKKRHAFGRVIEILKASAERIAPKCPHFTVCGGCHFQHIPYERQLHYKEAIFKEQLTRMGGIDDPQIEVVHPSKNEWNYRNAVQFHLTKEGKLGYRDVSNDYVMPIEECHLPMAAIDGLWPQVHFEGESGIDRVEIRQDAGGNLLVNLQGDEKGIPEIDITDALSVVHSGPYDSIVISGEDHLEYVLLGKKFRVSSGSFFQTNFDGADVLVKTVLSMTKDLFGTLFDLYSGVGLFSAFLRDQFDRIVAIEGSHYACDDFAHNLADGGEIDLYEGSVEKILGEISEDADCIIVDPPRGGLHRYAADALVNNQAPKIIYVSCNPATLGRDIKRLGKGGYELIRSVVVDMFPQTYHIESVNMLELR